MPDVIINTAALKHVPICENNAFESVIVNILGHKNLIEATKQSTHKIETLIFVSTDKACKPINVYGMCKATLERFTTGLASDLYSENIGVNAISPGLVATPGVKFHKLINERNENNVTPIEHIAEASLRLVYGNAQDMTGRITYAAEILEEFSLQPVQLIGST